MKHTWVVLTVAWLSGVVNPGTVVAGDGTPPPADNLARKLCAAYEKIDTVTCEVHKTITTAAGTLRWLSRVYYQRPDHIHVENVIPEKRRIIADGEKLYYYREGEPRGFAKPVGDLTGEWQVSLKTVPGSPMEHLLKLRDLPETSLPATDRDPVRRGYQTPKVFVVLCADAEGKLVRIEFYAAADMKLKTAEYDYDAFQKVNDGCWIPCMHKATMYLPDGQKVEEVRRIRNLQVNQPVASGLFDSRLYFKDVEFTDEFKRTYSK